MPEPALASSPSLAPLFNSLSSVPRPPGGLFLVGGSIRDMLLGRPVKDLDLVCRGARDFASDLAKVLGAVFIPLGEGHDPPSFRLAWTRYWEYADVTELFGPDITSDLARRDFTANALALRLDGGDAGMLIDPFQGRPDIDKGFVRLVGENALREDPLRILRGFRLQAQLDWNIEPDTLKEMSAAADMLAGTAGERIASELRLILECRNAGRSVREMDRTGVLFAVLPELAPARGCPQNRFHHLDVLEHSLAGLDCCEALLADPAKTFEDLSKLILDDLRDWRLPWLKLAVLLHDLGKPGTHGQHPRTGQATFYGHDDLGAQLALQVAGRLRLSRAESGYIAGLVRNHLHVGAILTPAATTRARMRLLRRLGGDVIPSVLLCLADSRATLGPASDSEYRESKQVQGLRLIRDSLGQAGEMLSAPALVSGRDLLRMGLRPGPELGRVLKAVRDAQDAGEVADRDAALRLARKIADPPED